MHVLITGITGFIGASLAARFLERGARVTGLARGEDAAARTREAVAEAAKGFGFAVDAAKVVVLPFDFKALEAGHATALADLDFVWHCAAHMTFSNKQLRQALDFNVGGTRALYELVSRCAKGRPRFYYVSTAYTGGVESEGITEVLHLSPHLINPYFVSKWGAELVLDKLSSAPGALPVTCYRPTIVIGHAETGWYGGQSFGLYNFLDGVWTGKIAGGRSLHLDIDPATLHNWLPIDDLVYNAVALTELTTGRERFETLIEQGTDNDNQDRVAWIAEGLGLEVGFGRPASVADRAVDLWVQVNKPFNQPEAGKRPFPFVSSKIAAMLGPQFRHHVLDREIHLKMIRWYRENKLVEIERKASADPAVRGVRLAHATSTQALLPSKIAAGLVARAVAKAHGLL